MWRKGSMQKMRKGKMQKMEEMQHAEDGGKTTCQKTWKRSMVHMQTNLSMLGLGFLISM
jgi:hypothetical protein